MGLTILYLFLPITLGAIIVEIFNPSKGKHLQLLLTFSGAFLLAVSILHLIPELFNQQTKNDLGIYILLGFLLQIILEYFSKGIEHGHFHQNKTIPLSVMISLCLHALLEGVPLGGTALNHTAHNALLTGILLHKTPVAIVLFSFFLQSGMHKSKAYFLLFIFATTTPIGVYFGNIFGSLVQIADELMALVIGIFLHISTTILFESTDGHKFSLNKIIAIITGTAFAILSL